MKGMKLLIVSIILIAFVAIAAGPASAAINVYVNTTTPSNVIYQGHLSSENITIKNNENFPLRIYSVGAHYDWMQDNVFYSLDFGGGYYQIESNGQATPGQILINCENNVSTGYHTFYYKVDLTWYNSYMGYWVNETVIQPGTVFVESPLKPQALQQLQFANQTLADAKSANYSSNKATTDLNNAANSLNIGWGAYNSLDYPKAINSSLDVVAFVSDAKIAEKSYQENLSTVEGIVVKVNEKLSSVDGIKDPDAIKAVNQSRSYLNQTKQFIDVEDFESALTSANHAQRSADDAVQYAFYFGLKKNEAEATKNKASDAIGSAQSTLDGIGDMTSTSASGILRDARLKLSAANSQFNSMDYANATITANVASTLATQALSEEANYRMTIARSKIDSAGDLRSPDAKSKLDKANQEYNLSRTDFNEGSFKNSIDHANSAYKLANDTSTVEQKWRESNPLSAVTPGFEFLLALIALGAIFIIKERKG